MFSSAVWRLLCKSGLLSRIVQSRHSVLLVILQAKQNDDFELYVTKDRFYKAYGTLPAKTPTDFDKYVTAA